MPEDNEQREDVPQTSEPDDNSSEPVSGDGPARRYLTRRNVLIVTAGLAVLTVVLALLSVVSYRYGVFDSYIKTQFVAKMADMNIAFDADVFRVMIDPLALELKNATFNNRVTGEKLFFIRNARLGLTVDDLYAWQLSRDISVDSTEIEGAEVWIKFDENGRSNFDELTLVQEEGRQRVNFKYDSVRFSLRDAVVHFGDQSRHIGADANNVVFLLEPQESTVEGDPVRYRFDLTTSASRFAYRDSVLEEVALRALGLADKTGADVTELRITTPIGETAMSGRIDDWADPRYRLNVESTVDLTQTSNIFPLGTTLRGVGNFKGVVSGHGETYRIEGTADSQSLQADGVYLKAVNVEGTVAGTNSNYEANGKAVAELLTFEDFRIEFPQLVGNVRGTGSDFKWVGDLQAVALRSGKMTIGRLFLSDAVAEKRDAEIFGTVGAGRAAKFSIGDLEIADLAARNLRFADRPEATTISAGAASSRELAIKNLKLRGVNSASVDVKANRDNADVDLGRVRADGGQLGDARLRGVTADSLSVKDRPGTTDLSARDLRVDRVDLDGSTIAGLEAPEFTLADNPAETVIYSDRARVASVTTDGAVLGSLNIAGIRVTVREGVVRGTSNDIDAGNVTLTKTETLPGGGSLQAVRIAKPVFVLEPSGRYRASADMSIGGGVLGSVDLGAASASVDVSSERVELKNLTASVMNGSVQGDAVIARSPRAASRIDATFTGLDAAKLLALQTGRVLPLEGEAAGSVSVTFAGQNFRTATGTLVADISGAAGAADNADRVPVTGRVELTATNGLVNVDQARLNTASTNATATGRFDLAGQDSNLDLALDSSDASEVERIIRVLGLSPDLERQLDSVGAQFAGALKFNGRLTGNFADPTLAGRASLDTVILKGRDVGAVTTDILVSPAALELTDGLLRDRRGGTIAFNVNVPRYGQNNATVQATLTDVNAGDLLSALPVALPARLRDFTGQTSGKVDLSGLPNNASGEINIASKQGTIAGQPYDDLTARAIFSGTRIDLETARIRVGTGTLDAKGSYDTASSAFDLDMRGSSVPLPLIASLLPENVTLPAVAGSVDITATARGFADRPATFDINFSGTGHAVAINDSPVGEVTFSGNTANQVLNAQLTATLEGRPQQINATLNFGSDDLPFRVEQRFDSSPLGPFIAFIPALKNLAVTGTATGVVRFGGNLSRVDARGNRAISYDDLAGTAEFSQLALQIEGSPLVAAEPVSIRFNTREIVFERARFAGGGSNMTIAGTKALADDAVEDLTIDGRVNLNLLNLVTRDTDAFFSGFADVSVRYSGPKLTARLSGTANVDNGSVSTFVGTDRISFERIKTRIIFSSNQAQIDEATGYLGGGRFTASGGALLSGLSLQAFRFSFEGSNVTAPVPQDFVTTGDARLEIAGRRASRAEPLAVSVTGRINAERSLYTRDIDLSSVVGARREQTLSSGGSLAGVRFDIAIEGRDALVVRNNIADLTASVSLRVTGEAENPIITGRITANGGTIIFRRDRYQVQRGVLEFPPDTTIDPIISLQAESEIAGYQIFVNLAGPLSDTAQLNATVRSSPALPQADIVSLITTGSLSNTSAGIPTLAQTGINTAADILTDAIISNPARRATDKLFGLNVFELDPIISGERLDPGARLTVGRQINNNLRVTYSTNLSQDQQQVLALEYRVSNKLSFVAQYEQRSLSNVTRNRDNFSFEIRFRRRF
ncbi:MAG: translocation/assembly module TamB domain-containing protein [Pyrinomonadaceae bacterium]